MPAVPRNHCATRGTATISQAQQSAMIREAAGFLKNLAEIVTGSEDCFAAAPAVAGAVRAIILIAFGADTISRRAVAPGFLIGRPRMSKHAARVAVEPLTTDPSPRSGVGQFSTATFFGTFAIRFRSR
jgi:hypothetical protein